MNDDLLYVQHVLDCISRIEDYCRHGEAAFFESQQIQDAVLRNLQVLAGSAKRMSAALKSAHPEVDWRGMAGFRNVLVHHYLGINLVRVWEVVSPDLPTLRAQMEAIQRNLPSGG